MTVAAFMDSFCDLPRATARSAQRSGRAGDFYTSVDVGPLFGDLLELQIAEMAEILDASGGDLTSALDDRPETGERRDAAVDLVEAGAGNGRLSADILRAAKNRHPNLLGRLRLHLVESSPEARRAQPATLDDLAPHLMSSSDLLPDAFEGILVANELLDALPAHQVVMREWPARYMRRRRSTIGSRHACQRAECHRGSDDRPLATDVRRLSTIEGHLRRRRSRNIFRASGRSSVRMAYRDRLAGCGMDPRRGTAARGFIIVIDYGEARDCIRPRTPMCMTTSHGTRWRADAGDARVAQRPGDQDLTARRLRSVRAAAETWAW